MKKVLFLIIIASIFKFSDGQTLIKNIAPGLNGSGADNYYNFDSTRTIFFGQNGSGGGGGTDNWMFITDGTFAGTFNLAQTRNGTAELLWTKIDSLGFTIGFDATFSPVLIRSNGTISGTFSYPFTEPTFGLTCSRFFKISNKVCWIYYNGTIGTTSNPYYLFSYDLASNVISSVGLPQYPKHILFDQKEYNIGVGGSTNLKYNVVSNNNGFFCYSQLSSTTDSIFNVDLSGNFTLVATCSRYIMPEGEAGFLLGNKFLFKPGNSATPPFSLPFGNEPFVFDILSYSIGMLKDINPYFDYGSGPGFLALPLNTQGFSHQYIYFYASHADYGREIWITDGTSIGTQMVKDLKPGPLDGTYLQGPPFAGIRYIGDSLIATGNGGNDSIRIIKPTSIFTYNNKFPYFIGGQYLTYCWTNNSNAYFLDNLGYIYAPPYISPVDTLSTLSCSGVPLGNSFDIIENNGCLILTMVDCSFYGSEPYVYCNNNIYTVGIEEIKTKPIITLFPNPSDEILNIELGDNNIDELYIYNFMGQELFRTKRTKQINISNLPAGHYIIKIYSRETKDFYFAKFIKI